MKPIDQILRLSFKDVVDRLGLRYYHKTGQEYGLYSKGKKTDGRSFNEVKGFAVDFSHDRGSGSVFQFVSKTSNLNNHETYKRFEENFDIINDKDFDHEYKKLPVLKYNQKSYLESRGIDYEKVSGLVLDHNGYIATQVSKGGMGCGVFGRHPNPKEGRRFTSMVGSDGEGVYVSGLDYKKDFVVIVEGLFDYLTLRQFETNIIGVRSSKSGIREAKRLASYFEKVYLIPDNDDAGKEILKKFTKLEPYVLDLSEYGVNDVNDLFLDMQKTPDILESIMLSSQQVKEKIFLDKPVPYTRGLEHIDSSLGVFDEGDLVVVAGYAGVGKTEFNYFVARENAKLGNKTIYYTLELAPKFLRIRLARSRAGISKIDYQKNNFSDKQRERAAREYNMLRTIPNLELIGFESKPDITQLKESIIAKAEMGNKLFFIDNLGNISGSSNENERLDIITQELQDLKNSLDICIIIVHHMKKPGSRQTYQPGGIGNIRSSQKIIDNATLVLEVFRDQDPDLEQDLKSIVELIQYKDSMGGVTGSSEFHYKDGKYLATY